MAHFLFSWLGGHGPHPTSSQPSWHPQTVCPCPALILLMDGSAWHQITATREMLPTGLSQQGQPGLLERAHSQVWGVGFLVLEGPGAGELTVILLGSSQISQKRRQYV